MNVCGAHSEMWTCTLTPGHEGYHAAYADDGVRRWWRRWTSPQKAATLRHVNQPTILPAPDGVGCKRCGCRPREPKSEYCPGCNKALGHDHS